MQSIKESLQGSLGRGVSGQRVIMEADDLALIDKINVERNPSASNKVDSWGNSLSEGDLVLAVSSGTPFTKEGKWMSDNNLIVGKIVEVYKGGIHVAVLNPERLDNNENDRYYDWSKGHADKHGAVIVSVKLKSGIIKLTPQLLKQLFK